MKVPIIFCSIVLFVFSSKAQEIEDTLNYNEIVVYDNRISTPLQETSRPINILDKSFIQNSPAFSFEELLGLHAGLDVQQRGVHGIQANLSIRGGTFEQTLILINGMRMNDIQTGHHHLNIPIQPSAVERIEIIKGPAARRFGQNAYAGAINIITNTNTSNKLQHNINYGDFGTVMVGTQANFGNEKSTHLIQAQYNHSNGYRFNSDYNKYNVWYQNQIATEIGELELQGGYTKKNFGANGFYANPEFMDQYEEVETNTANLRLTTGNDKWSLRPSLYWRRNQDMYLFLRNNPEAFRNFHISHHIGLETSAEYKDKYGSTGTGIDIRRESLSSNNLGARDRWVQSFFIERHLKLIDGRLDITPGFTWTHFSDFGTFWYPGLDVGFSLDQKNKLFANIGQTYRVPSYTDLYYEDRANIGNPELQPEEALGYEIGYRHLTNRSLFSLNLFRRQTDNLIDWLRADVEDPWRPENISELTTQGIEIQYNRQFRNKWMRQLNAGYTYIDNTLGESNATTQSRYALENLRHQLVINAQHRIAGKLYNTIVYRYNDRISLDDYHLVDIKLQYELKSCTLFGQINNLFDTEYRESNLVPMPGRWVHIGIQWDTHL